MDHLLRELMHVGLTDKEAAVYVAAIQIGPASVQELSQRARVNRATTYVTLEALIAQGLMCALTNAKRRLYAAEPPERLLSLLRLQRAELEEKEHELSLALPVLRALFNAEGSKPYIRYFEGHEGLRIARRLFEKEEGEFLQIFPLYARERFAALTQEQEQHWQALQAQGVSYRMLVITDDPTVDLPGLPGGRMRLIPKDIFPIEGEVSVRGSHVYLYAYRRMVLSVVLTSREMADALRALFELAWVGASKYPTKENKDSD